MGGFCLYAGYMPKRLRVAVLFGGTSDEREVSLASGKNVIANLSRKRFDVVPIEIRKNGSWRREAKTFSSSRYADALRGVDLVFNALHGSFGEDGRVQALLEYAGVPYTGSGVEASSLGMDKLKTKRIVSTYGILTPKFISFSRTSPAKVIAQIKREIGLPCVMKPNASGSSVGISIIKTMSELKRSVTEAFCSDDDILIEEYISGRELTCGVLGNEKEMMALPPVEIKTTETFFDYHAKYHSKDTQEICPAPVSAKVSREIQAAAVRAHEALGCSGLTRSDFMLAPNGKLYFLEINTLPGLTAASLCPKEAAALGWSYAELLERIIDASIRPPSRRKVQ
jgi:D-alanine-D-alanine ligase